MKKYSKPVIMAVVIVALFFAALTGYRYLSERYKAGNAPEITAESGPEENSAAAGEAGSEQAPDFTLIGPEGNSVSLSEHFGKPVVINFWASWCSPCKSELQAFDELYQEYGSDIEFMMVNLTDGKRETQEGVKLFIEEKGYSFPVYYDTEYDAAAAYGVYSIPMTVIIDADGNISDTHIGAMDKETIKGYISAFTE